MVCRLYLITPDRIDPARFAAALAAALDAGEVACVQLRLKGADDDGVRRAAASLMPLCAARDVAFLINDRPDLAAELDADGVHIGQDDASYAAARALLGPERIVGVTCHDSRDLAITAADAGADYVAFGAFFPTASKAAGTRAAPDLLRWWSDVTVVPCVAIGGITAANCGPLVRAGADFLAVIGAVWQHPEGPAAGVSALSRAITTAAAAFD
ncbi:MAG: thiamine phosphate synthase [Alphaproteobacteria bacterium]|nr:thiamine phosphate synthase [Alphaproteobacteria bacterium]